MKKWEEEQRLRSYQSKIKNAKIQVPLSNPKNSQKIKAQTMKKLNDSVSSQGSSITGYYNHEKDDKNSIPLFKLLKLYNLQQYAQYLIGRGYGYDLTQFIYLSSQQLEQLTDDMKILPGHKTKFLTLIGFINDLLPELTQQQQQQYDTIQPTITPSSNGTNNNTKYSRSSQNIFKKTTKQQKSQTVKPKIQSNIQGAKNKQNHQIQNLNKQIQPYQQLQQSNKQVPSQSQKTNRSNTIQNKNFVKQQQQQIIQQQEKKTLRVTNIGYDFFRDDDEQMDQQFSQALDQILKQYQSGDLKLLKQPSEYQNQQQQQNQQYLKQQQYLYQQQYSQQFQQQQGQQIQQLSDGISKQKQFQSKDDISIIPMVSNWGKIDIQVFQNKEQKFMRNLEKRLTQTLIKKKKKQLNFMNKSDDNMDQIEDFPNLEISQIKLMYQSFDSGKLTSTLINLDIEEMCNCLGWSLLKHIKFQQKKSVLIESQLDNRSQNKYNKGLSRHTYQVGKSQCTGIDLSQNPIEEPTYLQVYNEQQDGLFESGVQIQEQSPLVMGQQKNSLACISERTFENSRLQLHDNYFRKMQDNNNQYLEEQSRQQIENILRDSLVMMKPNYVHQSSVDEYDEFNQNNDVSEDDDEQYADQLYHESDDLDQNNEQNNKNNDQDSLQYEDDSVEQLNYIKEQEQQYKEQQEQQYNDLELSLVSRFDIIEGDEINNYTDENEMRNLYYRLFYDNDKTINSAIPSQEVLSNYCKNIIITSKMEKEVTIICLIYIERLLIRTGLGLEPCNWRKTTFIALILASKIWDDESFENDNFSKAFPQYSTSQINELERIFLQLIEYNLYIKSGDYAKYYFLLRTYIESKKKSFPLRPLDLNTILNLQRNASKASRSLKETYNQSMNRSF